jgi:6-phospho-3-hexuloisomerase
MREYNVRWMSTQALDELRAVFSALDPDIPEKLCGEILAADRIVCYGVGREGLMVRALCMRLMHLGFDAHMVGDVTTPSIGRGGLLITSAGPGYFSTVMALVDVAQSAGARTLCVTAQPGGEASEAADVIVHLPAQTMADDQDGPVSLLPMGSLFEIAQLVFFDLVSIMLRDETGQSAEDLRRRHTNLE